MNYTLFDLTSVGLRGW